MCETHARAPRIEERRRLLLQDVPRQSVNYYLYLGTWEVHQTFQEVLVETRDPIFGYVIHPKDHFYESTAAIVPLGVCSLDEALEAQEKHPLDSVLVGCYDFDKCWVILKETTEIEKV